jgi:hypothetical protein
MLVMRFPGLALYALILGALIAPASAARADSVSTRSWTDAAGGVWTETTTVETGPERADRLVGVAAASAVHGLARFGPFVVIDPAHAALVDATDAASPARFAAMLRAYPAIRVLELVDCPGTYDDNANLRLGHMIRAHAIATDVPAGGSVRSGAVELFLAGAIRHAAPDADFGVHAWEDEAGRGPGDFAADAPVNRAYLDYYRAMGMAPATAAAFYALTNSVPNSGVHWLHTADIARFVTLN